MQALLLSVTVLYNMPTSAAFSV